MRLIDADKFLSQIEDQYMEHDITRKAYIELEDRIMQQPTIEERKTDCVPWEFLERYAEWFCAMVSFPEFIREAKAFYGDTYKAESGGNIT